VEWWNYIGYFILFLNIFLGLMIVFRDQKNTQSTLAWLMILLFLPFVGLFLYFIFGRELKNSQWNQSVLNKTKKLSEEQNELFGKKKLLDKNAHMEKYSHIIGMHLRNMVSPLTQDNSLQFLTNGNEKMEMLSYDITFAEHSIYVQYFSIEKDQTGKQFLELLARKASEGVKVYLIIDGLGSKDLKEKDLKPLKHAGGEVEVFFPFRTFFKKAALNHRNHRKTVVIDGKIGYIGGFNIGDKYIKDPKLGYWRDTHLRLTGSAVFLMADHFISDWFKSRGNKDHFAEDFSIGDENKNKTALQIVPSGPDFAWDQVKNGFIKMIQEAENHIYIQSPYFIPESSIQEALRVALLSGVDVKIMIPNKPDHMFVYWATSFFTGELLKEGASLYVYEKGFLHAKTLMVDSCTASVGTTNMDIRSMSLNFEINAFIYDEKETTALEHIFMKDVENSREITWEDYRNRNSAVKVKEKFSRLLAPLL